MAQCKRYSPCKILSLGQKIKLPRTSEKLFYKHIQVILCKKRLQKTANFRKIKAFLKMAKNGHNAKAIVHAKYSVWVKKSNCLKHAKNVSTNTLKLFYAKSPPTNRQYSKNESILKMAKNGRNARAIVHAKYSPWVKK